MIRHGCLIIWCVVQIPLDTVWVDIDYMNKVHPENDSRICSYIIQSGYVLSSFTTIPTLTVSCIMFVCTQYRDFTVDPSNFPADEFKQFISDLHKNGRHLGIFSSCTVFFNLLWTVCLVLVLDPAICRDDNYQPYQSGLQSDVFIKVSMHNGIYPPTMDYFDIDPVLHVCWSDILGCCCSAYVDIMVMALTTVFV